MDFEFLCQPFRCLMYWQIVPEVDLFCIRDEKVAEEIADYHRQAGIEANLVIRKRWCDLYRDIVAGKTPLIFLLTGGYSIPDANAVFNLYFLMNSPRCLGSNSEIDSLLRRADHTADAMHRPKFLTKKTKIITGEDFWVPLSYGNSIATMNRDLEFQTS